MGSQEAGLQDPRHPLVRLVQETALGGGRGHASRAQRGDDTGREILGIYPLHWQLGLRLPPGPEMQEGKRLATLSCIAHCYLENAVATHY